MFEYNDLEYLKNKLKTDLTNGLTENEAQRRMNTNGKNLLIGKKKDGLLKTFFNQLKDPMIYILLVAIVISIFLKEYSDSIVIAVVVLLNALIGTFQEIKTEKALEMLKKMSAHKCQVIRDGQKKIIDASELAKGDLVYLEAGNSVGADLRIVENINLKIDESSITGESHPATKSIDVVDNKIRNLGDKNNMAYMSTLVVSGRGKGVVVATGMNTEIGKIANLLKEDTSLTPLQKRLFDLSKLLGILTVVVCGIMFLIAIIEQRNILDMLISSISLAVAAIPEGLPAVVTIVLAIGVQRMIKVNTIVKRLPSVETLGAVSVVCSDKTGTLTENKLKCDGVFENYKYINKNQISNDKLKLTMALCNNAVKAEKEYVGSPIEVALLKLLEENNYHFINVKRIEEKEFDSSRKMMSTLCVVDNVNVQFTKGAYDRIITKCKYIYVDGLRKEITKKDIQYITNEIDKQASLAKRILSFAYRENINYIKEEELTFLGFATFIDPPREGVKEAIEKFSKAGVKTIMITGDYVKTGYAIAKQIGIAKEEHECISGEEIDGVSQEKLVEIVEKKSVFARVSPQHKARIVEALKSNNKVVAMTGDGVNDAPSLKKADIGISMGISGSDVAKEASDMILVDDNFTTIETAIEEGRTIYNNIKKSVLFLLSSNFAEIIVMIASIVMGLPLPLLAIHILIVNLLTDSIPALALGADCKDADVMNEKPRDSKESLFANGGLLKTVIYGFVISMLTLFSFALPSIQQCLYYGVDFNLSNMKQILLEDEILLLSQTCSFVVLSLSELFYSLSARNDKKSVLRKDILDNRYLIGAIFVGVVLTAIMLWVPQLRELIKLSNISAPMFMILVAISASVLFIRELIHPLFHMKHRPLSK